MDVHRIGNDEKMDMEALLDRGRRYLEGDGASRDYEQAVYWLSLASSGSSEARALLDEMQHKGLGIECAVSDDDEGESVCHEDPCLSGSCATGGLRPERTRCINCGVVDELVARPDGFGMICGSCAAEQYLPLKEQDLKDGLALQPYTTNNEGMRSYFGAQIHALKYDPRLDGTGMQAIMGEIVERIKECDAVGRLVSKPFRDGLVVVPVPSSQRRKVQPVYEIARLVADGRFAYGQPLMKHSSVESKSRTAGTELPEGEITCNQGFDAKNVLLIDDTYGEGATARACIKALRGAGVENVFLLTLCRNMYGGVKAK